MRIAVIVENFDPAAGGRERSTQQVARELIRRGYEVAIIANSAAGSPETLLPGSRFILANGLRTKYALGLWRFSSWVQRQLDAGNFDASLSMTMAVAADVVQPREGTVVESRRRKLAMDSRRPAGRLRRLGTLLRAKSWCWLRLERRTLRSPRLKRVVAISQYVQHQLNWHYGLTGERVAFVPNAAEVPAIEPAARAKQRAETRRRWKVADDDVVYFFASMEAHRKGLAQAIAAFAKLLPGAPKARLVIAGLNDAAPRREIARLGLTDAVRWLGPTRQIDECYAASDVTILPSWYDPASKVVIESLLHGVPAISTLTNGASEWIYSPDGSTPIPSPFDGGTHGVVRGRQIQAGRVVAEAGDVASITQAMAELYDPVERSRCAAACAGMDRFLSMKAHVGALEMVLASVARTPRPPSGGGSLP